MKSAEETRKRLDELMESTFPLAMEFSGNAILECLPYEQVKDLLKDDATKEAWEEDATEYTEEGVIGLMRDCMDFAWGKALGHRGISAGRSVARYVEWLRILEDVELLGFAEDEKNYPQYGAPVLGAICEKYGFDVPRTEEGLRMSRGEPCVPDCQEGCE